jgi:hypothetical protein
MITFAKQTRKTVDAAIEEALTGWLRDWHLNQRVLDALDDLLQHPSAEKAEEVRRIGYEVYPE